MNQKNVTLALWAAAGGVGGVLLTALLGGGGCYRNAAKTTRVNPVSPAPRAAVAFPAKLPPAAAPSPAAAAPGFETGPLGFAPALPPVPPELIKEGQSGRKVVALTFDACWKTTPAQYDAKIIQILRQTHTPATLLLGGLWMEHFPRQTADLGHDPLFELGNHSYDHPHTTQITPAAMQDEILRTQAIQYRLTGKQGTLFRPPYGEYNEQVVAEAAQCGLRTLFWSVESGDPDRHQTAHEILKDVRKQLRPGAVIIMHMNGRGWHSAEALQTLIPELKSRGWTFVKVSDL